MKLKNSNNSDPYKQSTINACKNLQLNLNYIFRKASCFTHIDERIPFLTGTYNGLPIFGLDLLEDAK